MKIAITWTTGFVWWAMTTYFQNKGHEIIALTRKDRDITLPLNNTQLLNNCNVFIHSAANVHYAQKRKQLLKDNTTSIGHVIQATKHIPHFIYISSSSVYQWLSWTLTEDIPINISNLQNWYALSKYKAEQLLLKNFPNKLTILRPRAIYGPGDTTLLPNILSKTLFQKLLLWGPGTNTSSITHIDNLIKAIELLVHKQSQSTQQEIFNIADQTTFTMKETLQHIASTFKLNGTIHLPLYLFYILKVFNKNKYSFLLDLFENNKILNTDKIRNLGHNTNYDFISTLHDITWSISPLSHK